MNQLFIVHSAQNHWTHQWCFVNRTYLNNFKCNSIYRYFSLYQNPKNHYINNKQHLHKLIILFHQTHIHTIQKITMQSLTFCYVPPLYELTPKLIVPNITIMCQHECSMIWERSPYCCPCRRGIRRQRWMPSQRNQWYWDSISASPNCYSRVASDFRRHDAHATSVPTYDVSQHWSEYGLLHGNTKPLPESMMPYRK